MKKAISVPEVFERLKKYGLEERPRQALLSNHFAALLYKAQDEDDPWRNVVVEGGTGIGKTLAYLIPLVLAKKDLLKEAVLTSDPRSIRQMYEHDPRHAELERTIEGKDIEVYKTYTPSIIIVSTATKMLQDQLCNEDLPKVAKFLEEEFGETLSFVKLEGASNYICHQKTQKVIENYDKNLNKAKATPQLANFAAVAELILKHNIQTMDELRDFAKTSKAVKDFLNDPDIQEGELFPFSPLPHTDCKKCSFRNKCKFNFSNEAARKADVVVVNHYWFIQNIFHRAIVGHTSLTPYQFPQWGSHLQWAVVFDEAHQLARIFETILSTEVNLKAFLNRLQRIEDRIRWGSYHRAFPEAEGGKLYLEAVMNCKETLGNLLKKIEDNPDQLWHPFKGDHQEEVRDFFDTIDKMERLHSWFSNLSWNAEAGEKTVETSHPFKTDMTVQVKLGALEKSFLWFYKNEAAFNIAVRQVGTMESYYKALKVERKTKKHYTAFRLNQEGLAFVPLAVGTKLRKIPPWRLLPKCFCSATIADHSAKRPFAFFLRNLGLPEEETVSVIAPSPFPYHEHSFIFTPSDVPDPKAETEAWRDYVVEKLPDLIDATKGGTLVLFTNYKQMKDAYFRVRDELGERHGTLPYRFGLQGFQSTQSLKDLLKNNPNAVVFGVETFWQGFDVPGHNLRHVIMVKLPFDAVNDPVFQEREEMERERLQAFFRAKGIKVPPRKIDHLVFKSLTLPRAIMLFKQGFGRLIRSHEDKGVVTILDPRVMTKSYGARFLEVLPKDIPVIVEWEGFYEKVKELGLDHTEPEAKAREEAKKVAAKAKRRRKVARTASLGMG